MKKKQLARYAVMALFLMATISAIGIYLSLGDARHTGGSPDRIEMLLNINLVLLLVLGAWLASRIYAFWRRYTRRLTLSQLHIRLVFTFCILAATPAIIMTVFSAVFFHYGIQTWFSERVSIAIEESQAVAEAYLEEHIQIIRADALAMANDLERQANFILTNDDVFQQLVLTQALLRNFREVLVFDRAGNVLARAGLTFSMEFDRIPDHTLRRADRGEVVIETSTDDDRVRALVRMGNLSSIYLYVGRSVDPLVLSRVTKTREASSDYQDLQKRYSSLQFSSTMLFVVVGFLLVLAAIWLGLILARQLVRPIMTLIDATDRMRAGDLDVHVETSKKIREFDHLARAFNRMTRQIKEQQSELISANRQLDQRRMFTETVLSGVSSGVIGISKKGHIRLMNAASCALLSINESDYKEKQINDFLPEISDLMKDAQIAKQKTTQHQVTINRNGQKRIFLVRIAFEENNDNESGAVITFDDITELHAAQKKAAWSDVARRIAHEIKNPLTPIQLSAERLKRKYLPQIRDSADIFEQCTDTIMKHVTDIGNMVNEFSEFARMPEIKKEKSKFEDHIKDTIAFFQSAHPDISMNFSKKGRIKMGHFDPQKLRQALTNLIQNAIDSIEEKAQNNLSGEFKGKIVINLKYVKVYSQHRIIVSDNGKGLPEAEHNGDLLEPYVTHKKKGTGLGLAIVSRIMADHGGKILLDQSDLKEYNLGGATIALVFPSE